MQYMEAATEVQHVKDCNLKQRFLNVYNDCPLILDIITMDQTEIVESGKSGNTGLKPMGHRLLNFFQNGQLDLDL